MNGERWQQVKQLLDEAITLDSAERGPFLDRKCAADSELRREVESLLSSHEQAGTGFLGKPAVDLKAAAVAAPARDGRRIGVYQIVEEIGHGGMGEVYRAVRADGQYTKEVAIKLVRGGFDRASVIGRFRNERQILASLDHPNIARLLDGGTTEAGVPYLVMELVEGKSVDKYCDAQKISIGERLQLFRQICAAVQYAHQRLVIHRDIKPSNILVTNEGVPKLLDFGIAKLLDPTSSEQTTLERPMTPEYASPEQIRGEAITTASDVYSLGVVLYQLLTGRSPYPGETRTPHELARAVCETEPGRPSTAVLKALTVRNGEQVEQLSPEQVSSSREASPGKLSRRLAGDLDNIVLMALRKEVSRRYASVEQFAEDIRRHLEGLPVAARKGSWSYRAEKFVQRHKLGIASAAVVVLAVAGGVGATIREARIARAEAVRAQRRFNDVRHLANKLIFDVNDSIAGLSGSTPARKLLVDEALRYLDTLANEAKGDFSLQRELAAAYQRLGDIQGNPYHPNIGDTGAGLESYRKALAMRESIAAANPGNKGDQIALAFTHEWLGSLFVVTSGNLQDAQAEEIKALKILEPMANKDPDNIEVLRRLQGVYATLGDIEGGNGASANVGDTDSALENRRKALSIQQRIVRAKADADTNETLALQYANLAEDLVKKGDRAEALEQYQKGVNVLKQVIESSADPVHKRNLGVFYERIGNVLMMDGKTSAAMKNYRAQMEISARWAEEDPKNAYARLDAASGNMFVGLAAAKLGDTTQGLVWLNKAIDLFEKETTRDPKLSFARRQLALAYLFRGEVLFDSGKMDGALSDFRKNAAIYEAIAAANENDTDARIQLAATTGKIAEVLTRRGESSNAIAMHQKTLSVVESFAHSAHPLVQAQYTAADAYSGLGSAFERQASPKNVSLVEQAKFLTQACSWFGNSVAEWRRIPNPGKFSPQGFETAGPSRATQELSSCEARLKDLNRRVEPARGVRQ